MTQKWITKKYAKPYVSRQIAYFRAKTKTSLSQRVEKNVEGKSIGLPILTADWDILLNSVCVCVLDTPTIKVCAKKQNTIKRVFVIHTRKALPHLQSGMQWTGNGQMAKKVLKKVKTTKRKQVVRPSICQFVTTECNTIEWIKRHKKMKTLCSIIFPWTRQNTKSMMTLWLRALFGGL